MEKLLAIRKRPTVVRQREDVTRLTGDAAPVALAGANWATEEFPAFAQAKS